MISELCSMFPTDFRQVRTNNRRCVFSVLARLRFCVVRAIDIDTLVNLLSLYGYAIEDGRCLSRVFDVGSHDRKESTDPLGIVLVMILRVRTAFSNHLQFIVSPKQA